jgi:hypothetical protein
MAVRNFEGMSVISEQVFPVRNTSREKIPLRFLELFNGTILHAVEYARFIIFFSDFHGSLLF